MSPFKFRSEYSVACLPGLPLPLKLAFAVFFMALGSIHLETKLGITFLMLLMSPVTVFAFFIISMGMGFHFGEGAGLPLLFLISIPIDIWALGLVGRTFFLENLRLEPPVSLGLSLWARFAVAGALYLPLLWLIEGGVTDIARSTMQSIRTWSPSSFQLPNESVWNSRPGEAFP